MTLRLIPFAMMIVVNLLVDGYIYRRLREAKRGGAVKSLLFAALSVLLMLMAIIVFFIDVKSCSDTLFLTAMWLVYGYFTFYAPRIIAMLVWWLSRLMTAGTAKRRVVERCAGVCGWLIFIIMCWSAVFTPREIDVNELTLQYDDLPAAFDGYRIVQFSDTHLGSYFPGDTSVVSRYVDVMNNLNPDLLCFTGDLVNRHTREALPFERILARLRARDGVYAISGNHDYDDYSYDNKVTQKLDRQALLDLEGRMGWITLENEHRFIRHDGDSIAIIGVGNYGAPTKPNHGDYISAYTDYKDDKFKILLHHSPGMWYLYILEKYNDNVQLSLAGHTHAMQMMITIGPWRFSPAGFLTKYWGGLYDDEGRYLYVNIGVGQVGIPARIGAVPEIAVITLKRTTNKNNKK